MAFQLSLATSPEMESRRLRVTLKSSYFKDIVDFPMSGTVILKDYKAAGTPFDLSIELHADDDKVGVQIANLGPDDALSLFALEHNLHDTEARSTLYLGNVWHAVEQAEHCTVTCDDGTTGECCVTCRRGRSVTKVCC
jgi:hypothetical protein